MKFFIHNLSKLVIISYKGKGRRHFKQIMNEKCPYYENIYNDDSTAKYKFRNIFVRNL